MLRTLLDRALAWLDGRKTYLSAAGLAGLGLLQLAAGQVGPALQSLLAAAAAAGLRHAVGKATDPAVIGRSILRVTAADLVPPPANARE